MMIINKCCMFTIIILTTATATRPHLNAEVLKLTIAAQKKNMYNK